jgi:hypothetical protein
VVIRFDTTAISLRRDEHVTNAIVAIVDRQTLNAGRRRPPRASLMSVRTRAASSIHRDWAGGNNHRPSAECASCAGSGHRNGSQTENDPKQASDHQD